MPLNVVAIVQARMGSTRLPGKVLADVAGQSMLARVCRRAGRAGRVDRVVVATTDQAADDAVVEECDRIGVAVFRGSVEDVLDRYDQAARTFRADVVVRVTADCPLIDPGVIDRVVGAFLDAFLDRGRAVYASNTLRRRWPRGLDTEVFSAAALARAAREATEPFERAHVTPYLYGHPELFPLSAVAGPEDLGEMRWTVDLPEDLEFVRAVYRRLGGEGFFGWDEVRRLIEREPALAELNRNVRQKPIAEG